MNQKSDEKNIYCPEFDPISWDGKVFEWKNKKFIQDSVFTSFYIWYTTCPKCAKKYCKNYVLILAEIDSSK